MLEIIIDFDGVSTHQVRNFGEVLFDAFKDDKPASVSLDEIDRAIDRLRVVVRYPSKRRVRSSLQIIERLLELHLLASRARISQDAKPT